MVELWGSLDQSVQISVGVVSVALLIILAILGTVRFTLFLGIDLHCITIKILDITEDIKVEESLFLRRKKINWKSMENKPMEPKALFKNYNNVKEWLTMASKLYKLHYLLVMVNHSLTLLCNRGDFLSPWDKSVLFWIILSVMSFNVFSYVVLISAWIIAFVTFERLHSRMKSRMILQSKWVICCKITYVAFEWFFIRMNNLVSLKALFCCERRFALITFKSFSGVRAHVIFKSILGSSWVIALFTFVRFLARMNSEMCL